MSNYINTGNLTEVRFKVYRKQFWFTGISLLCNKTSKIYKLYSACIVFLYYSFSLNMIIDVVVNLNNFEHAMETARIMTPIVSAVWMDAYLRTRRGAFERVIRDTDSFIWEDMPSRDPNTGYLTMAALIPWIQLAAPRLSLFAFVTHTAYVFARIFASEDRPLALNAWYPFDVSISPTYELVILSQIIATTITSATFFAFMGLYATLVSIACSQLEKLGASLLGIKQKYNLFEILLEDQTENEPEVLQFNILENTFLDMQKQLNNSVRHHQQIIRFVHTLEDLFNVVLLGSFLFFMGSVCFAVYSVVTSDGRLIPLIQAALVFTAVMVQLYVFCWFGTELSEQMNSIRYAAWECDWVGMPIPFQRSICIIITRTNDFTLTAGKFIPVTKVTMIKILQQTFSYLTFLLNVRDTNNLNKKYQTKDEFLN